MSRIRTSNPITSHVVIVTIALTTCLSLSQTPNIVIRGDVPQTNYDALLTNAAYSSVGAINAGGSLVASGVLIAPNWVLTAAHVVDAGNNRNFDNLLASTSSRFVNFFNGSTAPGSGYGTNEASTNAFSTSEWLPHPDFQPSTGFGGGWDIALIRIGRAGGITNYQPARLYRGTNDTGVIGTYVGYGSTGTGEAGGNTYNGSHRYAAQNMIDADGTAASFWGTSRDPVGRYYIGYVRPFYGPTFAYWANTNATKRELVTDLDQPNEPRTNWFGSADPLPLEGGSAPGDSGGGLFIDVAGEQQLAGIVEGGFTGPTVVSQTFGYGTQAINTRVAAFVGWIEDQLNYGSIQITSSGTATNFDTPSIWTSISPTGGTIAATPDASQSVVLNTAAQADGYNFNGPNFLIYSCCYNFNNCPNLWYPGNFYVREPLRTSYTLTFTTNRSNTRLRVRRGADVTLDLGGNTYTLTSTSPYSPSVVIGQTRHDFPILTITNGTIACFDAAIAEHHSELYLDSIGRNGTVNVAGAGAHWVLSDSLFIGGRRTGPGGPGTVNILSGAKLLVAKNLKLWFHKRYGDIDGSGSFERCGTLALDGGSVNCGALDLYGGVITGSGNITVSNATTWLGGTLTGNGSIDMLGGITISGGIVSNAFTLDWDTYSPVNPPPVDNTCVTNFSYDPNCGAPRQFNFSGWSITNHAAAVFNGTLDLPAANAYFENLPTAHFEVQADHQLSGTATFDNQGLFRKSGGTNQCIVSWTFNNTGTLQVESGTLLISGLVPQLSNSIVTTGTWNVVNGSTLLSTQAGPITTNRAIVLLDGSGSSFTNLNTIVANEGSLTIQNNQAFATGGDLYNTGTLALNAGGTIHAGGSFAQAPGGQLNVSFTASAVQNPLITSVGSATLAGSLVITITELPAQAATIQLISFPSSTGTFNSVQLPTTPGATYQLGYSPTNVILSITPTVLSPLINSVFVSGTNLVLTWKGGTPPFSLEMSPSLNPTSWRTIAGPTTSTNFIVPLTNTSAYFKISSP